MKKMSQVVLGSILTFGSAGVLADDHEMFGMFGMFSVFGMI